MISEILKFISISETTAMSCSIFLTCYLHLLSTPASDHVGCCNKCSRNLAVLSLVVSDAALAAWLIGIMLPFYVRSLT